MSWTPSEGRREPHYVWQLRPYFRQVAGQLALGSAAGIVMNTAIVLPALTLGRAIDTVTAFANGLATAGDVLQAALLFVAGTFAVEGPRVLKRWWLVTANGRIRANLRADALRGVLDWPMARLHDTPVGDVMARIVGDVEVLGVGIRELTIEMWDTVLFSLSLIAAMLVLDPGLTVVALLPAPLAMFIAHATGRLVSARTRAARQANASLTASLQEQLAGLRVLRLFGRSAMAVTRIERLSRAQADANLATIRLRSGLQPVYTTLMTAGVIVVIWWGGERVIAGTATLGMLVAYLELYLRFVNRGFRVPQLVNSIQSGAAAYTRLRPLLAPARPTVGERPFASFRTGHVAGIDDASMRPRADETGPLAVDVRRLAFRYPAARSPVLRDVSLDIPPGALVAVTGPVGSGKSALARVLVGLYPPEAGDVLIGGRPLDGWPPAERAARVGYLSQDPFLVSGTIRENVLLDGAPPSAEEGTGLRRAIDLAALADDVRGFPLGLDTQIGESGIRVSGGQRQRIALARALAAALPRSPGLLVLDDPFSAVDVDTEARIVDALIGAFGPTAPEDDRATIVLFSHRLAVFPRADLIVVLDDGRIVERGTHARLIESGGLYARIYRAQRAVDRPGVAVRTTG